MLSINREIKLNLRMRTTILRKDMKKGRIMKDKRMMMRSMVEGIARV